MKPRNNNTRGSSRRWRRASGLASLLAVTAACSGIADHGLEDAPIGTTTDTIQQGTVVADPAAEGMAAIVASSGLTTKARAG